jgi:hypothetical protein
MSERRESPAPRRDPGVASLALANEMFKDAFRVVRARLAAETPGLGDAELDRRTAAYFARLPESPV